MAVKCGLFICYQEVSLFTAITLPSAKYNTIQKTTTFMLIVMMMMMMIEDDDYVERAMKIMMVLNPKRTFAFSRVFFRATLTSRNGTEKGIHDQTQSEEDEGKKTRAKPRKFDPLCMR